MSELQTQSIATVTQSISNGNDVVNLSDQDKADIIQEVLTELYAKSQQIRTLEKVSSLAGITTIPGVRNDDDIVAVPLGLLTVATPKQIQSEEDIAILEAKGELIATQIYFTEEEND